MSTDFSLTIVREGAVQLIVPADHASSGPSSASMPVFYNPSMEFNRDVSVAILRPLLRDDATFLDGLAASGARGIRVAKESGKRIALHLNDRNENANTIMQKNLDLNGISGATITNRDLRALLLEQSYDCVDIDPFGTPIPFFPMAVGAVRNGGILCVTATDTGTISGIFSKACLRTYGCVAKRTPFCHELGVRNLIGFIAREAARMDKGITPIASYHADHYVRTFVRVTKGAGEADRSLSNLGYCRFDRNTMERLYVATNSGDDMGPIWISQASDANFLRNLALPPHLKSADRIAELRDSLVKESRVNRPFFLVDELARKYRFNAPTMDVLIARLNTIGFATRTHFGPKTFSTDLDVEHVVKAITNC